MNEETIREKVKYDVFMKLGGDTMRLNWDRVKECTDNMLKVVTDEIDDRIKTIRITEGFNEDTKSWDLSDCDDMIEYYKMKELEDLKDTILNA